MKSSTTEQASSNPNALKSNSLMLNDNGAGWLGIISSFAKFDSLFTPLSDDKDYRDYSSAVVVNIWGMDDRQPLLPNNWNEIFD